MNVKQLMDWLSNYPEETPVTAYLDGHIQAEGQWLVEEENLEYEKDPENGGKLPVPQVIIGLDAGDSVI